MAEKRMTEMSYKEMQELMNGFIDRSSSQYDEMPATSFFELLFEQMAQRTAETVEIEGEVVEGHLVLNLPPGKETAVHVQGNEILIGDRRIVVKLRKESEPALS
jgi:hypothetical protein